MSTEEKIYAEMATIYHLSINEYGKQFWKDKLNEYSLEHVLMYCDEIMNSYLTGEKEYERANKMVQNKALLKKEEVWMLFAFININYPLPLFTK